MCILTVLIPVGAGEQPQDRGGGGGQVPVPPHPQCAGQEGPAASPRQT